MNASCCLAVVSEHFAQPGERFPVFAGACVDEAHVEVLAGQLYVAGAVLISTAIATARSEQEKLSTMHAARFHADRSAVSFNARATRLRVIATL